MLDDWIAGNKNNVVTLCNKANNINYSIYVTYSFHYFCIERFFIEAHSENIVCSRQINLIYVHCRAWNYIARYD
jgi:hypothetical protein